jgi:hypothetical protein
MNNDQNQRTYNYTLDSRQAAAGLHLSAPIQIAPLTYVMFHKDSFLLQASKKIRLNLQFLEMSMLLTVL